jgi:hypothetical protein
MSRSLAAAGIAAMLSTVFGARAVVSQAPAEPRAVFVTVTERDGTPVADLSVEEFAVKEGGRTVQIVQAALATEPMQIALIVDDNGTGLFRAPLSRFVHRLEGRASMALSSVTGQTMKLVDYTTSIEALDKGLATLSARPGTPDGGQLLEGISEAAKELQKREARRPIIIALTVGGEEHSTVDSDDVLDHLRRSGAILHVFSVINNSLRSTVATKGPSSLLQENLSLQKVLGEGPRQSGGSRMEIAPTAGNLNDLQNLAIQLLQQYRVAYTLPAGARPSDRIAVSVTRRGVSVRAPTRIPK